jgi:isocitrate dehydrogenase kinase/phosphatase
MIASEPANHSLALSMAERIRAAFESYNLAFRELTQSAKHHFERRAFAQQQALIGQRIDLYDAAVKAISDQLHQALDDRCYEKALWAQIKGHYSGVIVTLLDQELYKTFFNSVTRRFFKTRGVDGQIEFVALDIEPTDRITHPVSRLSYSAGKNLWTLFRRVLDDFSFHARYAEPERCARLLAEAVSQRFADWGEAGIVALELLTTVFYRERRAYLVGRVFGEGHFAPLILALKHDEDGIRVDAVMSAADDVTMVFGFTRSPFLADLATVGDAVVFLRSLMPSKPIDELYSILGRLKQGKTERYRHFFRHLESTTESFVHADGERGMVMLVFHLPSYELVFKVIRDRFAPPKEIDRQGVMDKYQWVYKHDRVGRLVDAQEFRYLKFQRARFAPELLQELIHSCRESVIEDGAEIVITHAYVERKLRPLNLYVQEAESKLAERAVLDYAQAIKDLALGNVFAGDMLPKNFGITRHCRAIFYDYDELAHVSDLEFRYLPQAADDEYSQPEGSTYYVGERDVFPEQFIEFMGFGPALRAQLRKVHPELFDPRWWMALKESLQAGQAPELSPYDPHVKLRK